MHIQSKEKKISLQYGLHWKSDFITVLYIRSYKMLKTLFLYEFKTNPSRKVKKKKQIRSFLKSKTNQIHGIGQCLAGFCILHDSVRELHSLRWVSELCVEPGCGVLCGESDSVSPILSLWAVYICVQGRLSKSSLSLWRRLSCPYTELPCCEHTRGGRVGLSNPC